MSGKVQSADFESVTQRQRETWATGDFHEIARQNIFMADALCRVVDPHPGDRVLDIGCGSGTAALVAARRYCEVTGIDYVPALIDRAKRRARAEGFDIDFRVADAQALPFSDGDFDAVLSVFGVQFAPNQQQAADEMLRVCRPGGKVGLATPIPEGWTGDFFATIAKYMPPPPGVRPALYWGSDGGLDELIGAGTRSIRSEKRTNLQYYRSVDHAVDVFLTYFGPTARASDASDDAARKQLRNDLHEVFSRYNRATDGTAIIEARYLSTVAIRS